MNKVSCGPLYNELRIELIDITNSAQVRAFAAGFAAGECEKVYLGACKACMFRPENKDFGWLYPIAFMIAKNYGLRVRFKDNPDKQRKREIWVLRDEAIVLFEAMNNEPVNSPQYHTLRAQLCGIPDTEIDTEFHLRHGAS